MSCASFDSSRAVSSSIIESIRSMNSCRCSADIELSSESICAICLRMCSSSSCRFCGGSCPNMLPYLSMNSWKLGSPPVSSMSFRSRSIWRIADMSPGVMFSMFWRMFCIMLLAICPRSSSMSSWNLRAASGSMNSYSLSSRTAPPRLSGKSSSVSLLRSTCFRRFSSSWSFVGSCPGSPTRSCVSSRRRSMPSRSVWRMSCSFSFRSSMVCSMLWRWSCCWRWRRRRSIMSRSPSSRWPSGICMPRRIMSRSARLMSPCSIRSSASASMRSSWSGSKTCCEPSHCEYRNVSIAPLSVGRLLSPWLAMDEAGWRIGLA